MDNRAHASNRKHQFDDLCIACQVARQRPYTSRLAMMSEHVSMMVDPEPECTCDIIDLRKLGRQTAAAAKAMMSPKNFLDLIIVGSTTLATILVLVALSTMA